jgi:pimeloyl-ACP methyl ester carboxylesterase
VALVISFRRYPNPTLVITGTGDLIVPPTNYLVIAEKIPGAWLVQIKGGGHGFMFQYPESS